MLIIGLDMNVLMGWYNVKFFSLFVFSLLLFGVSWFSVLFVVDVVMFWDVCGDVSLLEEMCCSVLVMGVFFKDLICEFFMFDVFVDYKSLFFLYQGFKCFVVLVEEVKDKEMDVLCCIFLENCFQEGIGQFDMYFQFLDLMEVNFLKGEELCNMESEVVIFCGSLIFMMGLVYLGDFDVEVVSLIGDVQFDILVVKNGVMINIVIDFVDMGVMI